VIRAFDSMFLETQCQTRNAIIVMRCDNLDHLANPPLDTEAATTQEPVVVVHQKMRHDGLAAKSHQSLFPSPPFTVTDQERKDPFKGILGIQSS
jgi:hypothetical protein